MKAISLKAGRSLDPSHLSALLACRLNTVRNSLNPKAWLTVGVIAIMALFVSLGAMNFTAVVISGLTALLACAAAPVESTSRKGGEL